MSPDTAFQEKSGTGLWDFMAIAKALADENRVRMLLGLREQELCLCQIIELIGLAPSTVSKHMSILRQARLVEGRKEGRWHYYRLAGEEADAPIAATLEWLGRALTQSPLILQDQKRLRAVLKESRERLCEKHRGR